jgi:hypothetical protein
MVRTLDIIAELRGYPEDRRPRQRPRDVFSCDASVSRRSRRSTAPHRARETRSERFHRRLRDECLNEHDFQSLFEARRILAESSGTTLSGLTEASIGARPRSMQHRSRYLDQIKLSR